MSSDQLNSIESKLKQLQKQEIPGMSYKNKKPVEIKQTVPDTPLVQKEQVKETSRSRTETPPEPVRAPRFETKETTRHQPVGEIPPPQAPLQRRPPLLQNPPRPPMSTNQQSAMYTGQPLLSGPIINTTGPPSMYHPMPNLSQPPPPLMQPMMPLSHPSRYAFPPPPLNRPPMFNGRS